MNIGAKIKRLRLTNGLTLEELANRSELTKGFLSQLERDLTSPSVATLEDILEALGTNLKEFFAEEEDEQIVFGKNDFFINEQEDYKISYIIISRQSPLICSKADCRNREHSMRRSCTWNPFTTC